MKIRKQLYQLQQADFDQYPLWEFALDEIGMNQQDDFTVRPVGEALLTKKQVGIFVSGANFKYADGTTATGFVTLPIQGDDNLGILQPMLFSPCGQQIRFWHGLMPPTADELAESYQVLARKPDELFPLKFESIVPCADEPVVGELLGFMVLLEVLSGETKVVQ